MTLAEQVLVACRARGWMVATAESCTGGMVSAALTDIAGSSDVFERGFVTYSNTAKTELLEVSPQVLEAHGAVSEETAAAMVRGALAGSAADLAVSITGVAGPGGTLHKPEGMVCFGIGNRGGDIVTQTHQFGALGRAEVRQISVQTALTLLLERASQDVP